RWRLQTGCAADVRVLMMH
ncbi:hypothetical protein V490_09048, partial [Pseudogymnoascus sp. VKM F-3557]